jgi:F-type H+-transporting ATPase subunit delta
MLKGLLTTALPLTQAQHAVIESRFSEMMGETVALQVREDKNLLGGVKVELNGKVYDGSLRGQLQNVLNTLQVKEEGGRNA